MKRELCVFMVGVCGGCGQWILHGLRCTVWYVKCEGVTCVQGVDVRAVDSRFCRS